MRKSISISFEASPAVRAVRQFAEELARQHDTMSSATVHAELSAANDAPHLLDFRLVKRWSGRRLGGGSRKIGDAGRCFSKVAGTLRYM